MSNKPLSIRFSEKMIEVIQRISSVSGQTPSDFIRAAVEEKARGSRSRYRDQYAELMLNPGTTMDCIYDALSREERGSEKRHFNRGLLSVLMHFWHASYLNVSEGFANPIYVKNLLDLTKELLIGARDQGLHINLNYIHARLEITNDIADYEFEFIELWERFKSNNSIGWAEILTRPLVILADDLEQFDLSFLLHVFNHNRIEALMPLAIKGAAIDVPTRLVSHNMEMILPGPVKTKINSLGIVITSDPFALVIDEAHHAYAFSSESLVSLFLFSENHDSENLKQDLFFCRKTLAVCHTRGLVHIHEHGQYRLVMSKEEWGELIKWINEVRNNPQWSWMLQRFRYIKGDV